MFDKLTSVESKYEGLMSQLGSTELQSDPSEYKKAAKTLSDLEPLVQKFREYKGVDAAIAGTQEVLDGGDPEMRELAQDEMKELQGRREALDAEIPPLLVPKDPNDDKNVLLEIRAGTGGDEAALFAADVFRMYSRYAEQQRWKVDIVSVNRTGQGGIKEVIAMIEGDRVYSKLRYESGVHRVQRVPATEASGRIHTSAITVAVLPEAEEVDVKIEAKDLRIDTFCSSGPGGQSVNPTYSAVRITHLPTNTVVSCQDEKSQIKNRDKAMRVLRARLQEIEEQKQHEAQSAERKSMVGSGDRSEKIRTYNFKENRVSDHRIGLTIHQLDLVMEGGLDPFIDALVAHYQAEKLKSEAVAA